MFEINFPSQLSRLNDEINQSISEHPIWQNKLLTRLAQGKYNKRELQILFAQHYAYSSSFTQLLMLAASQMTDPSHRAIIVENLYEEVGEEDPTKLHSELMKQFLKKLGVVDKEHPVQDFTTLYIQQCREFLKSCDGMEAASFLGWGTESIVPKLYTIFINALRSIDMQAHDYLYFSLHIECDDEHHEALANIVFGLAAKSDQNSFSFIAEKIKKAACLALDLRNTYFEKLANYIENNRLSVITTAIKNTTPEMPSAQNNVHQSISKLTHGGLYSNNIEAENISFSVARTSLSCEVLDPRLLIVEAGKRNEHHHHAHESFFYVLAGTGKVFLEEQSIEVKVGDMIYVPRWVYHHTENTGDTDLQILAITDFGLTKHLEGNTESSYRNNKANLGSEADLTNEVSL